MNTLKSLVPSWLHREDEPESENYHPIPTATMPDPKVPPSFAADIPEYSQADHERDILGKAAVIHAQLMRDKAEAEKREQQLKIELTEALLGHEGINKKVSLLELENIQLRNDLQTLQVDLTEARRFMSLVRQVLDKFGVKAPEKKPRPPRKKKVETETPQP